MSVRSKERENIDDHNRITLLEVDADKADEKFSLLFKKFDRLTQTLIGLGLVIIGATVTVAFTTG